MNELVLFIDLQNDFMNIMDDKYINYISSLCKYLKLLNKKMLFIKSHYFEIDENKLSNTTISNRLDGTHIGKKICISNTYGAKLINCVDLYATESNTIIKNYYSGFKNTNLDTYLKHHDIKTLVFCGLTINTCVKATILDGLNFGYNIKIIKECVTGINEKMTIKGLEELKEHNNVSIVDFNTYTRGFEIFCEGDCFILNDVFPPEIYNSDTFNDIISECDWKTMEICSGKLARLVDVQAIIDNNNKHLVPVYRNPSDTYIEPHTPTQTIQKMFDWLNSQIFNDENGIKVNHVFLKYYKSCADGIGKHSDKTLDLDRNSYILNLSLGSTRTMTFTSKSDGRKINSTLKSNSILFIGMNTNKKWLHEVKPDLRPEHLKTPDELGFQTQRLSLTFRTARTYFNTITNKLEGQGAPKFIIEPEDESNMYLDRQKLIRAFGQENKQFLFDWDLVYSQGFYSMCTK